MENRYKLSLTRSNRYLSAQVIEPKTGAVILGRSEKVAPKEEKKTKTEKARAFGVWFAKEAIKVKIKQVSFDRGGYHYHGRVKAFAEGAREGGLDF